MHNKVMCKRNKKHQVNIKHPHQNKKELEINKTAHTMVKIQEPLVKHKLLFPQLFPELDARVRPRI